MTGRAKCSRCGRPGGAGEPALCKVCFAAEWALDAANPQHAPLAFQSGLVGPRWEGWHERDSGIVVPGDDAPDEEEHRPTAIDLFSGAGGMSLGTIQAGYEVLAGMDNDPICLMTYLTNLGSYPVEIHYATPEDRERLQRAADRELARTEKATPAGVPIEFPTSGSGWIAGEPWAPPVRHFFFGDARAWTGKRILRALGLRRGQVDLVIGAPPCQGFSMAGKRNVMDPRNSLVFEFARLVLEIYPTQMVFENVPGIASMVTPDGLPIVDAFCRVLADGRFAPYESLRRSLLASADQGAAPRKDHRTGGGGRRRKTKRRPRRVRPPAQTPLKLEPEQPD